MVDDEEILYIYVKGKGWVPESYPPQPARALSTLCNTCNQRFGDHYGNRCPSEDGHIHPINRWS